MYPDDVDEEDLVLFLVNAKEAQYRDQGLEPEQGEHGEHVAEYTKGVYRYRHAWFGRQRFAGRETVFHRRRPVWVLQYYGSDHPHLVDRGDLYSFLFEALAKVDTTDPFRGPRDYRRGVFMYYNTVDGTVDSFNGEEVVYSRGEEVYKLNYRGGSILQERDEETLPTFPDTGERSPRGL